MTKTITLESLRTDIQQDIRSGIDDVLAVVKDLAQFTSDGFERLDNRMDRLEGRIGNLEKHAESVDIILRDHTARFEQIDNTLCDHTARFEEIDITLRDHSARFVQIQTTIDVISDKQDAEYNDIKEIYAILERHDKNQKLSIADRKDAEIRLNRVVLWTKEASKVLGIPIKL